MTKSRPEVVVIPALFDSNQDHIATAKIVLERLKVLKQEPKIVMYLVHVGFRRNFPKPYGYKPDAGISDPIGLAKPQRYFPSKHALEKKSKALKAASITDSTEGWFFDEFYAARGTVLDL